MSALLDLPLDEIAKKDKEQKRAQRGGARGGGRGGANKPSQKSQPREGGKVESSRGGSRGRGRGAGRARGGNSTRPRPYRREDRGDVEDTWTHDKFDTEGSEPKPASAPARKPADARRDEGHKIKIENLRYDVTEEDLMELFGQYGSVISASIKFDRDGRSTGLATVAMRSRDNAREAVQNLNGKSIDDEVMTVTLMPLVASGSAPTSASSRAAPSSSASTSADLEDKYKDLADIRIAVNTSKK